MTLIHVVDAFTRMCGAGNRAGVVLDADCLSDHEMQEIAAFAGYSETAFVLSPQNGDHDLHVRYFTPTTEVPICGHATIATHFLRAQINGIAEYPLRVKTGAGILPVRVMGNGEEARVAMTQGAVEYGAVLSEAEQSELLRGLGIENEDVFEGLPIQIVSTSHSKVMVPLKSRKVLDALSPDAEVLMSLSGQIGCNGYFPFVRQRAGGNFETHGRMFAPAAGIAEDPVTGNANGPAGAYLFKYGVVDVQDTFTYAGHQGHTMGKPGTIFVTLLKNDDELKIEISGEAVLAHELEFG